jgi:hypothetical protein
MKADQIAADRMCEGFWTLPTVLDLLTKIVRIWLSRPLDGPTAVWPLAP